MSVLPFKKKKVLWNSIFSARIWDYDLSTDTAGEAPSGSQPREPEPNLVLWPAGAHFFTFSFIIPFLSVLELFHILSLPYIFC